MFLSIGKYLLRKKLTGISRQGNFISFAEAHKVGLLYDATDEKSSDPVRQYVKKIIAAQKEVRALGFVSRKELPEGQYARLGMDFFTKKGVNLWQIPTHPVAKNFADEEFDILLDLTLEPCFPLQYLSAVSRAKFRVGRYREHQTGYYDLMIDLEAGSGLEAFIDQAHHYISLLNSRPVA